MKEEKREKENHIVVLDEGIDLDSLGGPGPESVCCWSVLSPLRG